MEKSTKQIYDKGKPKNENENPEFNNIGKVLKIAYICSPLKGDIKGNIEKAKAYCRIAFEKGYAPIAPHIYFTQFLDDSNPAERKSGLQYGLDLVRLSNELWVFGKQVSEGMKAEIELSKVLNILIKYFNEKGRSESEQ